MSYGPYPILVPDSASYRRDKICDKTNFRLKSGKFLISPNLEYWTLITLVDAFQGIVGQIWGVGHPRAPFRIFSVQPGPKIRVSSTGCRRRGSEMQCLREWREWRDGCHGSLLAWLTLSIKTESFDRKIRVVANRVREP